MDGFFVYESNLSDHIVHVKEFLKCCADQHIADKCQFFQTKTTFAGFLTKDPTITDAIARCPVPTNRTELRSFNLWLGNQLSSSTNAVASLLTPFRALRFVKYEDRVYMVLPSHDTAFTAAKASLTTQPILSYFDLLDSVPMTVARDWGTYFNSFTGTLASWSKQDPNFCQMLSLVMLPLSLSYLQSHGQSVNVGYSWQAPSTSWL